MHLAFRTARSLKPKRFLALLCGLLLLACAKRPTSAAPPASDAPELLELRYQGFTGQVSYPELAEDLGLLAPIAAEMIGAKAGLGYLIIYSQYNFQIPHMYLGIITITAIGIAFNELLVYIERRFTSWKPATNE